MYTQKNPCEHTVCSVGPCHMDVTGKSWDISEGERVEAGNKRGRRGQWKKSLPLYCLFSCLCALLKPMSERDRCPQNSCLCRFFSPHLLYFSSFLLRPSYSLLFLCHIFHTQKLKHKASCKVYVWSVTLVSLGLVWVGLPPRFYSWLFSRVCAPVSIIYLGFLLSLLFDLFSPSSLSLGPWQLLSQCFPPSVSDRGGWVEREREKMGAEEWEIDF